MDVLCVGLVVCDILAKPIDQDVLRRDSSRIETLAIRPGGDAMNVACNLARLGLHIGLVGRVGDDAFGQFLRREADKSGVRDMLITDGVSSTSTSIALLEQNGERHFIYYGKTNDSLCINDIDFHLMDQARHLHVGSAMALAGLDGDGLCVLFREAKQRGLTTSLDCTHDNSGRWIDHIRDALPWVDYFLPSKDEAESISHASCLADMEDFFKKAGVGQLAVKMGDRGCFVTDFSQRAVLPACDVSDVADTTGAGDAFVAGFLSGVLAGRELFECGMRGNYLAARCVESIGAQIQNISPRMLDEPRFGGTEDKKWGYVKQL